MSDTDALEKIRKLIEKGEFKVDLPKTAELILREAIAAAGNPSKF
jgi:anti-sigma28 factor (negative regulator of flagellin synthesis)